MFINIKKIYLSLLAILGLTSINIICMQSGINKTLFQYAEPAQYKNSNFKIIAPYFIQADPFSCGYRAAFHAIAFENALKSGNFNSKLNANLSNESLLKSIYKIFSKQKGLSNVDIDKIAQKYGIGNKLIVLNLESKNKIGYLGQYSISYSGKLSKQQINALMEKKKSELLTQKINSIKTQLYGPNKSGYFVCSIGKHWILLSIITDNNGQAKLYMIDSNVRPIGNNDQVFIDYFLNITNQINKNKKAGQSGSQPKMQPAPKATKPQVKTDPEKKAQQQVKPKLKPQIQSKSAKKKQVKNAAKKSKSKNKVKAAKILILKKAVKKSRKRNK